MTTPPAGWYDDPSGSGGKRWYDGEKWTEHLQAAVVALPQPYPQPQQASGPMTAASLNVQREVVYTRQQTPHSLTKWILISVFTAGIGGIWLAYYSMSPNHYWTA